MICARFEARGGFGFGRRILGGAFGGGFRAILRVILAVISPVVLAVVLAVVMAAIFPVILLRLRARNWQGFAGGIWRGIERAVVGGSGAGVKSRRSGSTWIWRAARVLV